MSLPQTIRVALCVFVTAVLIPALAFAGKPSPGVIATWDETTAIAAIGESAPLTLRVTATADAPAVLVEIVLSSGVSLVSGNQSWTGALRAGESLTFPVSVQASVKGDWPIGARVTSVRTDGTEVSGAVLYAMTDNGIARFTADNPAAARLASASPLDLVSMGIAAPPSDAIVAGGPAYVATTVSGTVTWRDPEGGVHPVRGALVRVADAAGTSLALVGTSNTGAYSAAVNAVSVKVTAYTQDVDGSRAIVFPLNQSGLRYILESAVTPVTGATTAIDVTSAATVRGAPGAPSTDSLAARGFAVYDAMLTYWFQATALIGHPMQTARANFPESTAAGAQCGTSCYSSGSQQMFILRDDAFDWDVLGHEFFHFATNRASLRPIDTSLGGSHNGGSAIGQNDGTGHIRTRDEGMRLAWSEGLATAESLLLQVAPAASFGFPALLNGGDSNYNDTEDASLTVSAETPSSSQGFGSENSVLGVLWDLYDAPQDAIGTARDTWSGVGPGLIWSAVNSILPGASCDRVDRFWVGITNVFGITSPVVLQIAQIFALNNMAPLLQGPADNASVGGSVAPTFSWTRNGDPSASHRNSDFYLVFSRDNFQGHIVPIHVQTADATSYTPSDAEWTAVQSGGQPGQAYKWFVAGKRPDGPDVPSAWFWYSDIRTIVPRSIEAVITWAPLGADVDLHLSNPSGTDIAYYNLSTSWGFLDRDCITSCTREVLSVNSLPLRGAYRLWVHYYSNHGLGAATVRAVVRQGNAILIDRTFTLSTTGSTETLASFSVNSITGELVPEPAPPPGGNLLLPPKKPTSK